MGEEQVNQLSETRVSLPKDGWHNFPPHPWRRFFARSIDVVAFGSLPLIAIVTIMYAISPQEADNMASSLESLHVRVLDAAIAMLTVFISTFATAAFIGRTGTSLGKWCFGIRVTDPHGKPIRFKRAWQREIRVWFRGMGMGIPLVNFFTQIAAYRELDKNGETAWDKKMNLKIMYKNDFSPAHIAAVAAIIIVPNLILLIL